MDLKLVYPIFAILNRLCVNCVLIVYLQVNKYNTIQNTMHYIKTCVVRLPEKKWSDMAGGLLLEVKINRNVNCPFC